MTGLPRTMHAVVAESLGDPEVLRVAEAPVPEPGEREVLLAVAACGVCGHDLLQRQGKIDPEGSRGAIFGHEIAGTVVEVGEGVASFAVGDRVATTMGCACGRCTYCRGGRETLCHRRLLYGESLPGGYAEFVAVHESSLARVPDSVELSAAAIAACAVSTAVHALELGAVRAGDRVAVTGAGGGVGIHAIQVARAMGAEVIAVTSSAGKVPALEPLADAVVVLDDAGYERALRARGLQPDTVVDLTARYTLGQSLRAVRRGGHVVIAGNLDDGAVDVLPGAFIYRELHLVGSKGGTLRDLEVSLGLLARGAVEATIAARMPLAEAARAHELMEHRAASGRILLVP